MKTMHASLLAFAVAGILTSGASSALMAKEITVGIASTFTTMDPYDAGDTLSQTAAKSMYEGLFGLDKDMKIRNVLAESLDHPRLSSSKYGNARAQERSCGQ